MTGILNIKPLEAKLTHDTAIFTQMNPFCEVTIGSEKIKGQTCHGGGKLPTWQDVITVQRSGESVVYIELKDQDTEEDHVIGSCHVDLTNVSNHSTDWYSISFQGKNAGDLKLEIAFIPVANTVKA